MCPTLAIPWTVDCQFPPSMRFSRQEYWNGLPFPSPGDLPDPRIEPRPPALQADALPTELRGKPLECLCLLNKKFKHGPYQDWPARLPMSLDIRDADSFCLSILHIGLLSPCISPRGYKMAAAVPTITCKVKAKKKGREVSQSLLSHV